MQTRDEVEGLHNCREFSQPLECLYQDMQTQEKSFLLLLQKNFLEEKSKTHLFRVLFKKEILTSREVLYAKSVFVLQKRYFPKYGFSRLERQLKRTKNWHSMFLRIFHVSTDEEMGK